MAKYIVAVSGGVDSVVLLDILARAGRHQLIVAHVDHGMRSDSAADARFVAALAERYGLRFELFEAKLGSAASEDAARRARYEFLWKLAQQYEAEIATAQHADDIVETIALNIGRGTGWRGLAGMSREGIHRPFKNRTKSELIEYTVKHRLEWCEDETNSKDIYMRNQLRRRLSCLSPAERQRLLELWQQQLGLRREIDAEVKEGNFPVLSRYFLTMIDETTARELLWQYFSDNYQVSLLAKQLDLALMAIKVGRAGSQYHIGQGLALELAKKDWRAERLKK